MRNAEPGCTLPPGPRTTGFPWSLTTPSGAIVVGMKHVLVLGGGFAGVGSAAGAVRLARSIGDDHLQVRMYPPVDSADALLAKAGQSNSA